MNSSIATSIANDRDQLAKSRAHRLESHVAPLRTYTAVKAAGHKVDPELVEATDRALDALQLDRTHKLPELIRIQQRVNELESFSRDYDRRSAKLAAEREAAFLAIADAQTKLAEVKKTYFDAKAREQALNQSRAELGRLKSSCSLLFGEPAKAIEELFPPVLSPEERAEKNNPNTRNWQHLPKSPKVAVKPLPRMPHPNNENWANKGTPSQQVGAV